MKKILAIIYKDILVRFTSPSEWLFFLILPIIFTIIIGVSSGPPEDQRIPLIVVDEAENSLSADLILALEKSSVVRPVVKTLEEANADFEKRKVTAVLVIPSNFAEESISDANLTLELRQLPNNTDAQAAAQAIESVLGRVGSAINIANESVRLAESQHGFDFKSPEIRQDYFDRSREKAENLLDNAPKRLNKIIGNTTDAIDYDANSSASVGQMITWVFIPLIGLSATFAFERQKGTLKRLFTTPVTKALYLFATITGQVLTALLQMLLLIIFGILVMKAGWANAPLATLVMLLVSALAAAAMGTMLGAFVKTEAQANGLSIMFGMVMALMGGCWYPLELFPPTIQQAMKILPTTWAMQGLLDVVQRGQGLKAVLPEATVLLGFATLFFIVGILRFKYE